MTLPILGPTTSSIVRNIDGTGSLLKTKYRYKQSKPYNLPAPYEYIFATTTRAYFKPGAISSYGGFANANTGKNPTGRYAFMQSELPSEQNLVLNQARERFKGNLSSSASWLVSLAERKQSVEMIGARAGQIYRFTRALRRFDFHTAAKELGVTKHPAYFKLKSGNKLRKNARSFSNNFLEFHFGWSPLVKDIGSSIDFLQKPINLVPVKGHAKMVLNKVIITNDSSGKPSYKTTHVGCVRARVGAEIRINNTNLWLANRLGFTNPALVMWDMVPFSFVVDWFVNVSEILGEWNEFSGIDIINAYHTVSIEDAADCDFTSRYIAYPYAYYGGYVVQSRSFWVRRKLGIPSVKLVTNVPWSVSVSRALTAVSLLIQKGIHLK